MTDNIEQAIEDLARAHHANTWPPEREAWRLILTTLADSIRQDLQNRKDTQK